MAIKRDVNAYESTILSNRSKETGAYANALKDVMAFRSLNELSDPGSVGFKLFFRYDSNSGLLASEKNVNSALAYLKRIGDTARYELLKIFIKHLQKINMEMAFMFQTIEGLDVIRQHKPWERYEEDEAKITIGTLETVDFKIQSLISIYKDIWYDAVRMVEVLPVNLRRFDCSIYIYPLGAYQVNSLYNTSQVNEIYEYMALPSIKRSYSTAEEGSVSPTDTSDLYVKSPDLYNHVVYDLSECEFLPWESSKGFHMPDNISTEFIKNDICFSFRWCRDSWRFYALTGKEQYGAVALMAYATAKTKDDATGIMGKFESIKDSLFGNSLIGTVGKYIFDKALEPVTRRASKLIGEYSSLEKLEQKATNIGVEYIKSTADILSDKIASKINGMFIGNVYGISPDTIINTALSDTSNEVKVNGKKLVTGNSASLKSESQLAKPSNVYNKM